MIPQKIAIQLVGAAVGTALTFAWDKLRDDSPKKEDKQFDMWDVPGFQEAVYDERHKAWKQESDHYAKKTSWMRKRLLKAEQLLEGDEVLWAQYDHFVEELYMDEVEDDADA